MDIVIQKYGGTSVASEAGRRVIAENAKICLENNEVPVVVVSAIGRKGAPYATDSLIALYKEIYDDDASSDLDLLMSCGEVISTTLIANTLRREGLKSRAVCGEQLGIITDSQFGSAKVIRTDASQILRMINDYDVLVLAGFQGVSESGDITTLGRGGSDATAVIVGEMLKAVRVEIYTDVDGVMTADPRYVTGAKVLDQISYEEVYQMALDGARVIDSKAIAVAKRAKMELWVKNTFSKAPGTRIFVDADRTQPSMVTAIAHLNDIAQLRIAHKGNELAFDRLLDRLAEHQISIDLINFLPEEKFFTVPMQHSKTIAAIAAETKMVCTIVENCSKITIIGPGIHGVPGVMRRVVKALHTANVKILQTSDSYTTIACLIEQHELQEALQILHETFDLSQ
jgi:aspartate kinase